VRLKIPVQISYEDDPEQGMQLLLDAASVSNPMKQPSPAVPMFAPTSTWQYGKPSRQRILKLGSE